MGCPEYASLSLKRETRHREDTEMDATEIMSFGDMQRYIANLYANVNGRRPWDYLYGYLARSCGFMSVNAKTDRALTKHHIRALSWLFSLASQKRIDLVDAYLERFPGICYYCLSAPCVCHKTSKQPWEKSMSALKVREERQARHRDLQQYMVQQRQVINWEWIKSNISRIYPRNEIIWYYSGPWYHFAKLAEELGELHQAFGKFEIGEEDIANVREELADVLAWILSAWQLAFPDRDLQDEFIDFYSHGCPACRENPCKCPPRSDRRAGVVSLDELGELRKSVDCLAGMLGAKQADLADILESLDAAISSKNEQVALRAVFQTKSTVAALKGKVDSVTDAGKRTLSLAEAIDGTATRLLELVSLVAAGKNGG